MVQIISWKYNICLASQTFPIFMESENHTTVIKISPLDLDLNQLNLAYNLRPYFPKTPFLLAFCQR
jgi:hypothetical protein